MADLFEETFDATGYDLGAAWSETGSTVDEDHALPTGPPTGFGGQCLYISHSAWTNAYTIYDMSSAAGEIYFRFHVYFTTLPSSGKYQELVRWMDASSNFLGFLRFNVATLTLRIGDTDVDTYAMSVSTPYCIEVHVVDSTNAWEWKINGVSQGSGTQAYSGSVDKFRFGAADSYDGLIVAYIDNFKASNSDWVGAWSAVGGRTALVTRAKPLGVEHGMNFGVQR